MTQRDPDAFTKKYWPQLLIAFCAMILWYSLGDNLFAGAAGFGGLGWLAWHRLIKPKL